MIPKEACSSDYKINTIGHNYLNWTVMFLLLVQYTLSVNELSNYAYVYFSFTPFLFKTW